MDTMKEYQLKLDDVWKSVRWATDVITYARQKSNLGKKQLIENLYYVNIYMSDSW